MASDRKIFSVFGVVETEKVAARLAAAFPESHLQVGEGQWFVVAPSSLTTTDVSTKLGVTGENTVNAIVTSVGSYFGVAPLSVWEWLTAKMGASDGTAGQ